MTTPRPWKITPWTRADHDDNSRRIERDADRRLFDRLGRRLGISGRELTAALGRMLDDRIAAYLRANQPPLIEQLKAPEDADQLRGALSALISDDVVEMIQILTGMESKDDTRDTEETPGSSSEDAPTAQREIYGDEAEETETRDSA